MNIKTGSLSSEALKPPRRLVNLNPQQGSNLMKYKFCTSKTMSTRENSNYEVILINNIVSPFER